MSQNATSAAPFQREDRYIVIKISDLARVPPAIGKPFAEQLTAIQRRFPKRERLVIESDWPEFEPAWASIEARVTGKPAEQHQGEPVTLPARMTTLDRFDDPVRDRWSACLDEIAKLGPLYTHADPAEVERLRAERDGLKLAINTADATIDDLTAAVARRTERVRELESKLAEAHALLREIHDGTLSGYARYSKIEAVLSASAEPSAPVELQRMTFEYVHTDGERRTVSVSREEVAEHMDSELFEKLTETICSCEPIGETNVVDCSCDEVAEQFELVKPS